MNYIGIRTLAGLLCYVKCVVFHLFDNYAIVSTIQLEYEITWHFSKVRKAYLQCYFCDCCIFSLFLHFQKNILQQEKVRTHKEKCYQQTSNFTSKIFTCYISSTFLDHYCFHFVSDTSWRNTEIFLVLYNSGYYADPIIYIFNLQVVRSKLKVMKVNISSCSWTLINPFMISLSILYLLKTPEN